MYNVRYHIASLVSVFLALALGLILGGLVVQRGTIDEQQGSLVAGLQKEFSALRQDNTKLSKQNSDLSEFSSALTDEWVNGRLDGRTVVILARSARDAGVDNATKAIESAGGKVALVLLLKDDLALSDAKVRSLIATTTSQDEARASMAASLAAEWFDARSPRVLTRELSKAGVLRVEGLAEGTGAGGLVDLAALRSGPDAAALAILSAFRNHAPAVGAQTTSAGNGVAAAAHRAGAGAVDTLDLPIGRYSVVAMLSGSKLGYYGLAEQAAGLFPPLSAE